MLEMYKGVANSPETTITNDINNTDTIIYVLDETRVPDLPNLMVLGTGISAETVRVLSIDGNALTVERGFQGVPKAWNAGTIIARNFTEYDYSALVENIKTLKNSTDTNVEEILNLMTYVGSLESLETTEKSNLVLALNEIYQKLGSHEAENANLIEVHGLRFEKGTWTPALNGNNSYVVRTGYYIRIGKKVTVWFTLRISSIDGTGNATINGLPFKSAANGNFTEGLTLAYYKGINLGSGYTQVGGYLEANLTYFNLLKLGASGFANLGLSDLVGSDFRLAGSMTYYID